MDDPKAFSFDSLASNSMKSSNPVSGCREVDVAKTLDCFDPNPSKNQGGIAIVQPTMVLNDQGGAQMNVSYDVTSTLRSQMKHHEPIVMSAGFSFGQSAKARSLGYQEEVSPTLRGGEGGNQKPCVVEVREAVPIENHPNDSRAKICEDGIVQTLSSRMGTGGNNTPLVMERVIPKDTTPAVCIGNGQGDIASHISEEMSQTLNCMHDPMAVMTAVDCRNCTENEEVNGTLQAKEQGQNLNSNNVARTGNTVRRLTPLECERLQSFPDNWTNIGDWVDSKGKLHKGDADTPRYKALGNSIALPFWDWLLGRISAQYDEDYTPTLGSLFSGIGGFDLCWERHNGKGTARWQSEIEPFPIAVCKKHFGDEDEGIEGDLDEYL